MSDLIKREDAIEAYSDIYWIDDRLNLAFREELDKIDEKIRNIPSGSGSRLKSSWYTFCSKSGSVVCGSGICGSQLYLWQKRNSMSEYSKYVIQKTGKAGNHFEL